MQNGRLKIAMLNYIKCKWTKHLNLETKIFQAENLISDPLYAIYRSH